MLPPPPQDRGHRRPVLDRGAVHHGPQHQPLGVHQQVALAPTELLRSVIPSYPPHASRLDRLALENPGTRLWSTARFDADRLSQGVMHRFPQPRQPPEAEIMGHRLPRWQVRGQQPPGTTAAEDRADASENLARRVNPRPAHGPGRWHEGLERGPLGVSDIGRIQLSVHSPYSVRRLGATDHFSDSFSA
jgi:hypothetical protein